MPCKIAAHHWAEDVEDPTYPPCWCPHCIGECECGKPVVTLDITEEPPEYV